jgi:putative membrane protein
LFSRLSQLDPGPIAPVTALLTLTVGCVAALGSYRCLPALAGVLTLGAASEVCGLYTGFPFGHYAYTDRWWPTLVLLGGHRFPVQLPFAWLLMAGGAFLAMPAKLSLLPRAVLGALLAASLDLVMEPVMVGALGYWRWVEPGPLPGGAPIANFVGWFGTSLLAGLILGSLQPSEDERSAPYQNARLVLAGHLVLTMGIGAIDCLPG